MVARRLSIAKDYTWSVRPFVERFGDRALADIRTADVQDFVADLQKPRKIGRRAGSTSDTARRTVRVRIAGT